MMMKSNYSEKNWNIFVVFTMLKDSMIHYIYRMRENNHRMSKEY